MKNKIDIVTVAFSGEVDFLRLQAYSISKYFDISLISSYSIIWNEESDHRSLRDSILAENPKLNGLLNFYSASELMGNVKSTNGWRVQQSLKILISKFLKGNFQYTLDAKNHFIRPTGENDLFDKNGRPFFKVYNYVSDIFQENIKKSLSYCNVKESEEILSKGFPTITPVMQYPEILSDLIRYVENKENQYFSDAFINNKALEGTTEFQLYYAFLLRNHELFDLYTPITGYPFVTLFGSTINKSDELMAKYIENAHRDECKVFGIHRKRIDNLRALEIEAVKQVWLRADLLEQVDRLGLLR